MSVELRLKEFAGQRCDVVIGLRTDGTKWIRFETEPGYGHAALEEYQLDELLEVVRKL